MQVRTKIALCVSVFAAVVAAAAALLLWNTNRTTYNQHRTAYAYQQLAGYLQLSGEVRGMLTDVHKDIFHGSGEMSMDLTQLEVRIGQIVDRILISQNSEKQLATETASQTNADIRLSLLQNEFASTFDDLRHMARLLEEGDRQGAMTVLETRVEPRINGPISGLMAAGVVDDRAELSKAVQDIAQVNRIAHHAAVGATVLGIVLTGLVTLFVALRLKRSLNELGTGVQRFADGELEHRMPVTGQDEFALLAQRFNIMAAQLRHQREALEEARSTLELRVEERTEELKAANEELRSRDAQRRQFFADIGHELRTPITAVRGEAEVALRAKRDHAEIYRGALTRVIGISDQLTRFVNDIFLIAREQ
ncbi:MAG: HAMP domain-containing protein, partial [Pseudomonadota bacterium]